MVLAMGDCCSMVLLGRLEWWLLPLLVNLVVVVLVVLRVLLPEVCDVAVTQDCTT